MQKTVINWPQVQIWTDGGCYPNPGLGAWAYMIFEDKCEPRVCYRAVPNTTNNRMELSAAIEAIKSLGNPHQIQLFTDSQYLQKGITEWIKRWQRNGWRNAKGNPVENADLWRALLEISKRHIIDWQWLRGHDGDAHNERVDELCGIARAEYLDKSNG